MLQNKVAQTREENFTNANNFVPERWLRGGCPIHENHNGDVMKTFGGGPRYCPGKNLAMHEMTIVISSLCKAFNLSLAVDPSEISEQFSFTMFPKNLWVTLKPYNSQP